MGKTISIEPAFNTAAIQAYGDRHTCRDPQSHVQARLELLSELSDLVDADAERAGGESMTFEKLVWEIQQRHQATTNEFLGFFGTADPAASEQQAASVPHVFLGRPDRWCEVCNKPDRHSIHIFPDPPADDAPAPEIRSGPSDDVLRALARRDYASEDIEIESNAVVSRGEDPGAFVAAWVWVDFPDGD